MRMLLSVFILLLLIHLIAAVGVVGWLGASDRLSKERVMQVVDTFRPTQAAEAQRQAEAEAAAAMAAEARDRLMRLNSVGQGPRTIEDRLQENFEADEFDLHRLERLQAETQAIQRRLEQDKALIAQRLAELEKQQAAFVAQVAAREKAMEDEDFARAVKTLEQLPAKQAKAMVQEYLASGRKDEAVAYLAAMQVRKSAGVLKAFKDGPEIAQAAELLEALRTRGIDPLAAGAAALPDPRS